MSSHVSVTLPSSLFTIGLNKVKCSLHPSNLSLHDALAASAAEELPEDNQDIRPETSATAAAPATAVASPSHPTVNENQPPVRGFVAPPIYPFPPHFGFIHPPPTMYMPVALAASPSTSTSDVAPFAPRSWNSLPLYYNVCVAVVTNTGRY